MNTRARGVVAGDQQLLSTRSTATTYTTATAPSAAASSAALENKPASVRTTRCRPGPAGGNPRGSSAAPPRHPSPSNPGQSRRCSAERLSLLTPPVAALGAPSVHPAAPLSARRGAWSGQAGRVGQAASSPPARDRGSHAGEEVDRAVRVVAEPVAVSEGEAIARVGDLETVLVVHRDRPESVDRRQLPAACAPGPTSR